ncbi:hypothetical protein TWF225_005849 [Orbilia oligospora]|nr:hypothetical protein TWF225_005849 [Orbilia oligospora]KAF3271217.1 hypothetical protein TWF217_005625 [Orbilia oligospora]KAF3271767.1 hypothetical protein TWF128_000310 [Orbilia oligospora]
MVVFDLTSRLSFYICAIFGAFAISTHAKLAYHGKGFVPDYVLRGTARYVPIACEMRYSVLLNGTSPGPTLRFREGRTTWIRVYNDMLDAELTVHWHGLTQRTAPFSDGAPLVSQWPIPPGHFFDYEVRPDIGDAGTYFYHSHVGFQAVTAVGALIVEDARPAPYQYHADRIFQFGDYFNKTDNVITDGLLSKTTGKFIWSGETNALLLNGKSGTKAARETREWSTCAPEIIRVKPGRTYRFRFIGATALSFVTMGIESHPEMTIIEADGRYTQPYTTSHIQIASGQRFSTLFKAKPLHEVINSGKTHYWIQFENRERPGSVVTGYALLVYDIPLRHGHTKPFRLPYTLPYKKPLSLPQNVTDWLEYALQPVYSHYTEQLPPTHKVTRTIHITAYQVKTHTVEWAQNGLIWQEHKVKTPYLVDIYNRGERTIPNFDNAIRSNTYDPETMIFPARIGEVIDIVWHNNNGPSGTWDFHPFHAHGGHFWDLGSGNGTYDARRNDEYMMKNNYFPVLRDTTMVHRYAKDGVPYTSAGWRAWRVHVKYPGVWMMHCHILQHMVMGMQTVWMFGRPTEIKAEVDRPYVKGYLKYGGSAYGNSTYDPLVNEWFD